MTIKTGDFPYDLAFDRNLGWLTEWEQLALRAKRVAIAGMGGVGGVYLLTLARLGIGAFTIADFDRFEFANFNRQVGALVSTVGRPKAEVLEEMAREINPELHIRRFDAGVTQATVDDFLADAQLFVDGLDFFEIDIRRRIFARCRELGIPAITAAPIGLGVGYLIFTPDGMSFEQYFRFEGRSQPEQFLRFLMGLVPKGLHRRYLVDPARINLAARKGPSTASAVQLCAGVTAAAAVKLLLNRGGVKPAPWHHHFDGYLDRFAVTRLPFGLGGPIQRAKLALAWRVISRRLKAQPAGAPRPADPPDHGRSPAEDILNLARWTPSGDNTQPWRFQIIDEASIAIRVRKDPSSVYEYRDGEPTILAVGMLVESLRIAASAFGRDMICDEEHDQSPDRLLVRIPVAADLPPDPLVSYLTTRSVDRRPYRWRGLQPTQKALLESSVRGAMTLDWHERAAARWRCARLNAMATDIRLRCPEAFPIHQRVIDWQHAFSAERIPARAVGLAGPVLPMLRWALEDWSRMQRMNRLGTLSTAAQLDYLPGLGSAGFVVFRRLAGGAGPLSFAELIGCGRAIQRFWLTATRLGLVMQPTLAMLAFAEYGERDAPFTAEPTLRRKAKALATAFRQTLGVGPEDVLFVARVGTPVRRLPMVRSVRQSLETLIEAAAGPEPSPVPGESSLAPS
jgi:nitroreductase